MPAFGNATAFFHACEGLQGWEGCEQYVADNAVFSAQSEPIADISLVKVRESRKRRAARVGKGPDGSQSDLHLVETAA